MIRDKPAMSIPFDTVQRRMLAARPPNWIFIKSAISHDMRSGRVNAPEPPGEGRGVRLFQERAGPRLAELDGFSG
jgi:hypothetical protein